MWRTIEVDRRGELRGGRRARRLLAALGATSLLWLPAAEALAANGFDANRLQAPPLPADGLSLMRPGSLEVGTFSGAVTLSYANDPLVIEEEEDLIRILQPVISDQLWAYLAAGYGLTRNITLHLVLPISIHQEGNPRGTDFTSSLSSAAVADLRAGGRLRLFGGTPGSAFGAALDATLLIPTGSREAFASDGKLRFRGVAIAEAIPIPILFLTANVGVLTRPEIAVVETITENMLQVHVAGGLRAGSDWLRVGLEANLQTPFGDEPGTGFETLLMGALSLWGLNLSAGIGPGFGDGAGTPDFRVVVRAGWSTPASSGR